MTGSWDDTSNVLFLLSSSAATTKVAAATLHIEAVAKLPAHSLHVAGVENATSGHDDLSAGRRHGHRRRATGLSGHTGLSGLSPATSQERRALVERCHRDTI